jgi:hypothetical protein
MTDVPVDSLFPASLRNSSVEEKIHYFKSVPIPHKAREHNLELLNEHSFGSLDQRIVLLVGGAGVGKTDLLHELVRQRLKVRENEMLLDPHRLSAFYYEFAPPDRGTFEFTPYFQESMELMSCGLAHMTLDMRIRTVSGRAINSLDVEKRGRPLTATAARRRYIENCNERSVEIAALDEAGHAFKVASSATAAERRQKLEDRANYIKSLVNKSQTTYILCGAYDFFDLTTATGQLARRCRVVHVLPYHIDELEHFIRALMGFLQHLSTGYAINSSDFTELYLESVGCIGILHDIFTGAVRSCLLKRDSVLTMAHLRANYLTPGAKKRLHLELDAGIKAFTEFNSDEEQASGAINRALASKNPRAVPSKLKVGETKPSHRKDAGLLWDQHDS